MTLKDYYTDLAQKEVNPQKDFREAVIQRCRITPKTFYNWMDNEDSIPDWADELIFEIKQELLKAVS